MVTNKSVKIIGFILGFFLILGCNSRSNKSSEVGEDFVAKQNLQGIWLDDDDDDVVIRPYCSRSCRFQTSSALMAEYWYNTLPSG